MMRKQRETNFRGTNYTKEEDKKLVEYFVKYKGSKSLISICKLLATQINRTHTSIKARYQSLRVSNPELFTKKTIIQRVGNFIKNLV